MPCMDHDLCGAHLLPEKEEECHMLWLDNKFGRSLHEALHEASTSLLHCNCCMLLSSSYLVGVCNHGLH